MADVSMDFLLVTGMSGAGKTQAAMLLEDAGYFFVWTMFRLF